MNRIFDKIAPAVYLLLRLITGLMFASHGAQKLLGMFGNPHPGVHLFSQMGAAGLIELVGGVLIAVGLLTRFAAFLSSGEMAVAYFMVHFPSSFFPIVNKGELAVLYCFIFLYITVRGPGMLSLDQLFRRSGR